VFNASHPPFNNVAVRQAVAEAVDRTAVVTASQNGSAKPATSILSPSTWGFDPGSTKYAPKLNVSAARAAISAARATGPYTLLTPSSACDQGLFTDAEVMQAELAQVGMQLKVDALPCADWIAQGEKGNFDIATWGYVYPDPDFLYFLFHSSQRGTYNWTNMTDPSLDKLLVAGRTTLDLKKARADYYQAQKIVDTKAYAVPLYVKTLVTAVRKKVQGLRFTGLGDIQWEDVWVK
jgi:peptide/nickel transport system substrate-binding protein